ncbi:MAG TPA: complex I NDUFA9 subunit family protein [Casimicrobiaceae bacterium]|nr:complex I NDUFA9 subunit family protein [Casimicrobiaceae bacterium]
MGTNTILVVGGSGFVGRHVVNRLVSQAYRVLVPTRKRDRARALFLLPTVDVIECDVGDPTVLARLATSADAVINLTGILHETRQGTFDRVHIELTREIVTACRGAGVRRLLHMSALHADPDGPSRYLRSKGDAEAIVATSGLDWTIFQPSVIFGREDRFLNLFAKLLRFMPVMMLASAGTRFAPVYVGDVAQCFVHALTDDRTVNQRYPLCGPKVYTLRELVDYAGEVSGASRPIIPLGRSLGRMQAAILERLPGPLMTRDNLASMQKDSVCDGPFPAVFGITPTALEAVAPTYLSPESIESRFDAFRRSHPRA